MIQVLPPVQKKPSFGQRLSAGIGQGLNMGQQLLGQHQQKQALQQSGINSNLPQEFQKLMLQNQLQESQKKSLLTHEYGLKSKFEEEKAIPEMEANKKASDAIEKYYGKEAREVFDAMPQGGKTKVAEALFQGGQRDLTAAQSLGFQEPKPNEESTIPTTGKTVDFDKGLTPKERAARQENRYSKNLPLYEALKAKHDAHAMEAEELGILSDLSPQVGSIERLNINPQTGDLIIPAFASEAAQRFVKTVNDFTRLAKDSYGSRVTNFDLNQFMRRLPTLANTEEGRKQIIEQMQIINRINQAYERANLDVLDEYGGIRNIDWDQAQNLSDKKVESQIKDLKAQFKKIGVNQERIYQDKIDQEKKITPKDHVAVEKANGERGYIPKDKLQNFLKTPGNKAL